MQGSSPKKRIYELDYIRAISAIFIVLFHYTTQYDRSFGHLGNWPVTVPWGALAVNTFFLLTGYLTVLHYSSGLLQFAYKRWCRLWPTFALCIVITTVFMALLLPGHLRTVREILLNFTMLPAHLGARFVDGVYWTLSDEVIFYFWIAIILYISQKKKSFLPVCLYGWAIFSIVINLCSYLAFLPQPVSFLQTAFITEHAPTFIIGIAIFLQNKKGPAAGRHTIPLCLLCLVGIFLGNEISLTIWTALWALLIWAVTAEKLRFSLKENNPLHKCLIFMAGISYPFYLLHQFIGFAIIDKLEQFGCLNQLWIFVPITVSILLASAVHYWFELPIGNLLSKLVKKKAQT